MSNKQESKEALKATGTVGGGQVLNIIISLIRTKIIAVILGPSGIGVVGVLTTASDMIKNIAGLGLPFSGVRDISIAEGTKDDLAVSKIVKIFNKWVLVSAFLGACVALLLCLPLSRFLFKNDSYTFGIAFLSISIFSSTISSGYQAIMQGKRAILMMAKSAIIANLLSSVLSIIIYLKFQDNGIVPSLIVTGLINLFVSYYFYKKLEIPEFGAMSLLESWKGASGMIKLGIFSIVVSVFDQLMGLGLRGFIAGKTNVEGVGLYTAANTIATMYLSIVLGAMASDYYPKLSAIHSDNRKLHETVNSQLYIVLLLASPIIIGMVGFADIAIRLLYSDKFYGAVAILKWQVVGDFFKIISWPCGFVFLAKGYSKLYVVYSVSYTIIYMLAVFFGWEFLGFVSIGVSFCIAQVLSMLFTYVYSFKKFGIYIDPKNYYVIGVFISLLVSSFLLHEYFNGLLRIFLSGLMLVVSITYSIYHLDTLMDIKSRIIKIFKR